MNVARRGLALLVGAPALTIAATFTTGPAVAQQVPGASAGAVVNSCDQHVAVGSYACFAQRRVDIGFTSQAHLAAMPLATTGGYGPSSLQSAYHLPSATAGTGQRIYVVDAYDDPNAEPDLATYRSQYGLPACTTASGCFQKLNQNGQAGPLPAGNTGWAGEISLDLDMVSAICPRCGITLIEAQDATDNLFLAVRTAARLGAKFVSMSWGGPETGGEASDDSAYFQSSGVVYAASTGDGAYQAGVIYPATSPRVVAVGGTSLTSAANSRGWTETVWKNSITQGTGSGCSSDEPKPPWQSIISSSVCSRRAAGDVSAVADPQTGVAVYQTYGGTGWAVYGGTSASAPIIASVYALAGTPSPSARPASLPYGNTSALFDVTGGNNGSCVPSLLCTAAAGWDGPTGLGTPNGTGAFGGSGGGTGNTVAVTNPGGQSGTVGTGVSLQIQSSDSGGAALSYAASGLPAGLSINAGTGLISGTPSAAATYPVSVTATDDTGASGSASFTWTITSGGRSCSGQLLNNPGFESGSANWTAGSAVIQTDGAHSHAGGGYAWLDGYGRRHTDTLSQQASIPGGCTATLSYYLWIDSSEGTSRAYDTLKISVNGTTVQTFSNVNQGSGYVLRTVSLTSYSGRTVTIKWTGTEDRSVPTSFLIDDTALTLS